MFVDPALGSDALDYFLVTGKQKGTLHWVRTDAFPRKTGGKGERAERRGNRGRNEEDELEACEAMLLDV